MPPTPLSITQPRLTPVLSFNPREEFRLSPSFLDRYRGKKPLWGPLGEITFSRTYPRFLEDLGRFETPVEVFARVVEAVMGTLANRAREVDAHWSAEKAQADGQELFRRMWALKLLPAGRGLANLGTPALQWKGAAVLYNCFSGSEEFLTREYGPTTFRERVGQQVTVLTRAGWEPATVRAFGSQRLCRVTFAPANCVAGTAERRTFWRRSRSNRRLTVNVTADHRWLLVDGSETTSLAVGDRIPAVFNRDDDESSADYREGLRHGWVFGDGTFGYQYADSGPRAGLRRYQVRLCGTKAAAVDLFEAATFPPSYNGDPLAYVYSATDLKRLPTEGYSVEYLRGFLAGWLRTDGSDLPSGGRALDSQHPDAGRWLASYAALAGWSYTGVNEQTSDTNFGERTAPCGRHTLTRGERGWEVLSVEALDMPEEVFCAVVPGSRAFTLASGAYTGNCCFVSTCDLQNDIARPFAELMDYLMLGVGVGFDVRGSDLGISVLAPETTDDVHVVEDTREGWVAAVVRLLRAFRRADSLPASWDYSRIRAKGVPLKTFGGVSSGPGPLRDLIQTLTGLWMRRIGLSVDDELIVDTSNVIGRCVVAGGVRRSSEIALGPDTPSFLGLKDPTGLHELYTRLQAVEEAHPEVAAIDAALSRLREAQALDSVLEEAFASKQDAIDTLTDNRRLLLAADEAWQQVNGELNRHPLRAWRWASNNSILAKVGQDYDAIAERITRNGEPGLLWLDNVRAYGRMCDGDLTRPRIVTPTMVPNLRPDDATGVNPCAEIALEDSELCLAAGTRVLTADGYRPVESLVGVSGLRVAGRFVGDEDLREHDAMHPATAFATGTRATVRVTTVDGRALTLTPNHPVLALHDGETTPRWTPAEALTVGDQLYGGAVPVTTGVPTLSEEFYALGHFAGDGWFVGRAHGGFSVGFCVGPTERDLGESLLPVWERFLISAREYIETAYDDRYDQPLRLHEDRNGVWSVAVTKPHVARMLVSRYGFTPGTAPSKRLPGCYWTATADEKRSFLRALFDADGHVTTGDRRAVTLTAANEDFARDVLLALGEFGIEARLTTTCLPARAEDRQQTTLMVRGIDNLERIARHVLFSLPGWPGRKAEALARRLHEVVVRVNGSRLCAVKTVEPGPFVAVYNLEVPGARHYVAEGLVVHNCNLVETFPGRHEDAEDWYRTLKFALFIGKATSLLPLHNPRTGEVQARNRRLGISISGIAEWYTRLGAPAMSEVLDAGYRLLRRLDRLYSGWLEVPESIRLTTVKPSGTVSLLAGVEGGMRFPEATHVVRTIRIHDTSDLIPRLEASGYRVEPDRYAPNTVVAYFPLRDTRVGRTAKEVTLWEQVNLQALFQGVWADNSVSATLMFRRTEAPDVRRVIAAHDKVLKGLSMLPADDHGYVQPPYAPITAREYDAMNARLRPLDLDNLRATRDTDEKYCDGGVCSLPPSVL